MKISPALTIGILMSASFAGLAKSYERNCFREHISESIDINKEHRKIYQRISDGRSDRIFNRLIALEYISLAPATLFDLRALPYQLNGMDLFCHEFMSMNRVSELDPERRRIPQEEFKPFNFKFYKERIALALRYKDVDEVRRAALEGLVALKDQPNYYCFSRHFLESIYRFAYFVPLRQEQAEELGLKDPSELMLDVIKLHLLGIKDCHTLDIWAQPIQQSGIPILCSEIPDLLFDLKHPELDILRN